MSSTMRGSWLVPSAAPRVAPLPLDVEHACPEGEQGQFRHFKALQAEWDADDGDAVRHACDEVEQGHGDSREQHPEHVRDKRGRTASVGDGLPEGGQRERCHFEALTTKGDADDGDAEDAADQQPAEGCPYSSEDDPDDVP